MLHFGPALAALFTSTAAFSPDGPETPATPIQAAENAVGGFFGNIGSWVNNAANHVEGILSKAETELTAAEANIKAHAPDLAAAVDSFLDTATAISADLDPAAAAVVADLKRLFDGLINLVEKGVTG